MEEKVIQTKIGEEEARKALAILEKYKQGKKSLDERLIDNEQLKIVHQMQQMLRGNSVKVLVNVPD